MGGWFSSPEPTFEPPRRSTASSAYHESGFYSGQARYQHESATIYSYGSSNRGALVVSQGPSGATRQVQLTSSTVPKQNPWSQQQYRLPINGSVTNRPSSGPQAERSKPNPFLLGLINDPDYKEGTVVTYKPLTQHDEGYRVVSRMITNKGNFKVDSIEEICNPYLRKAYQLKKERKMQFGEVEERMLFHGTKRQYVDDICKQNFDWRMIKKFKYGRGVSFSPNSTYATNYSDQGVYNKVMIVAKVLIVRSCEGDQFTHLPEGDCDTTVNPTGVVIVKYEDDEFYPMYKINYHVMNENVGKKGKSPRRPTFTYM